MTRTASKGSSDSASTSTGSRKKLHIERLEERAGLGEVGTLAERERERLEAGRAVPSFRRTWCVTRKTAPLSIPPEKHTPIGSFARHRLEPASDLVGERRT